MLLPISVIMRHAHTDTPRRTHGDSLHTVILYVCVCVSSGKIFAALGFAAWCYQSCQAGRSAAQENVAGVESRHTFRVSLCVCVCTVKIQ